MKTGFVNQLRVKLNVYSELTGKSKLEAIYDALSIAKTVREKMIDLKGLSEVVEKKREHTAKSRLKADKKKLYDKEYYEKYYKANAEKIKIKQRELRLIKKRVA